MRLKNLALAGALGLLLASCGGGDSSESLVEGGVVKGPVLGATVCAFLLENGAKGAQLQLAARSGASGQIANGCYVTGADGRYSFVAPRTNVDILLESTGGTYCTDELPVSAGACTAGGTLVNMTGTMSAAARATTAAPATVFVTPLTTAAVRKAAAGNGGITVDNFAAQFTVLAGQVIGDSSVKPSDQPTGVTQPFLRDVAAFMEEGGSLEDALAALEEGSTNFAGGAPENTVPATISPALVGTRTLVFHADDAACGAEGCPFPDGEEVEVTVHADGRLTLGQRVLTGPFHRKLFGGTDPHLPEIIWRDSEGVEFALSNNETGVFNEINVGDGNNLVMPGGYPTFLGQLSPPEQ